MKTYNSNGYGAYHISKFIIELNRTVVLLEDFHRYILNDITDSIQNPQRTGKDAVHLFSGADIIDEAPEPDPRLHHPEYFCESGGQYYCQFAQDKLTKLQKC